ncbi:MAG TPA: helix-hairpin-helix domain-containing protein [Thermoanaerobaculia bacterium]|nr:helix-hairpin-helix domain-containing protein [Thermoanaerobaculia bacterium]
MAFRPIVRSLVVPILGLSLSGIAAHPAVAEGEAPATHKVVNVNEASAEQIARLPRVGSKLADRIVSHRKEHGPFRRAEDLMQVKGVGEKFFATLRPYVAVAGPTTLTEKVSSAGTRGGSKSGKSRTKAAKSASSTSSTAKATKTSKARA